MSTLKDTCIYFSGGSSTVAIQTIKLVNVVSMVGYLSCQVFSTNVNFEFGSIQQILLKGKCHVNCIVNETVFKVNVNG